MSRIIVLAATTPQIVGLTNVEFAVGILEDVNPELHF
jgi:hypothetical protein